MLAIHDARDFTKFLCALPRHPDDCEHIGGEGVHRRLREMTFKGAEVVAQAEAFLADGATAPLPVRAPITKYDACMPPVMNIFWPLSTHSSVDSS